MGHLPAKVVLPVVGTIAATACALPGDLGDAARPTARGPGPDMPDEGSFPVRAEPLRRAAPAFDVASTASTLDAWPRIVPGVRARSVTSFDRTGGNDDGFMGTYSELYVDSRGEHVIFDETGPGVLRTLWFRSGVDGTSPLGLGAVRFYFDDETNPRLVIDADALFAGKTRPFVAPLVADNATSSGGFASWAPLPFARRLRITTEKKASFYQAHHDVLPPDWDVRTFELGTHDAALAARFASSGDPTALPLEEVPLDVRRDGAGTVEILRFVPDATPSDEALRAAHVTVTFDDAPSPQVDVPLGFFFGSGLGLAPVRSLAWTMQPLLFESRIPMPFWRSVHVSITGLAGKLFLRVGPERWSPAEAGILEVRFREESPRTADADFVYADVEGTAKIVATVLGVDPADVKGWWEGDLRTTVDGIRTPALHGTGHEDDHLGGWSNEFFSRPFSLPMHGAPRTDITDPDPAVQINARASLYRLWPGIPFFRSGRHSIEHGPSNARSASYAAATFLYRQPRGRLQRSDAFDVADAAAARAHGYEANAIATPVLTSAFEGEDPTALTATLHTYDAAARFTLAIDPRNEGVELRRLFDRSEAPTAAAVVVDGVRITTIRSQGPWAEPRRWAENAVFVPAQVTRGKSSIEVLVVPQSGRRLTAARFEAWSFLP